MKKEQFENDELTVGKSFDELSESEMKITQGAGDVEGDTTPLTTVTTSSMACGMAIGGAAGAIITTIYKTTKK